MLLAVTLTFYMEFHKGPLLFNIHICDIFFDIIECDIASYVDDNTIFSLMVPLSLIVWISNYPAGFLRGSGIGRKEF